MALRRSWVRSPLGPPPNLKACAKISSTILCLDQSHPISNFRRFFMNRIVLTGIPNDELDVVIDQVCVVLKRNGVDYPILTFEHDPRKVIPVDPHTGQDTSGATCVPSICRRCDRSSPTGERFSKTSPTPPATPPFPCL